jgi:hypothetical protein
MHRYPDSRTMNLPPFHPAASFDPESCFPLATIRPKKA